MVLVVLFLVGGTGVRNRVRVVIVWLFCYAILPYLKVKFFPGHKRKRNKLVVLHWVWIVILLFLLGLSSLSKVPFSPGDK